MVLAPPHFLISALLILWICEALLGLYNVSRFHKRQARRFASRAAAWPVYEPQLVVMIAIKGVDEGLRGLMDGLLTQEYSRYRIIFIVETKQDPTFDFLRGIIEESVGGSAVETTPLDTSVVRRPDESDVPVEDVNVLNWTDLPRQSVSEGLLSVQLLVAGLSHNEAQKIHGQRVTLKTLSDADEALVFADADAVMGSDWLKRLVAPLCVERIGLATAWRWIVPDRGAEANLPTKIASIANASTVTLMGHYDRNYAWGGSMAMRHEFAKKIDLCEWWRGCINDDVSISRAVRRTGARLHQNHEMLVVSPEDMNWSGLWTFGRRQHLFVKTHALHVWATCTFGLGLYTAGFLVSVIVVATLSAGWAWAAAALVLVALIDYGRARGREAIARQMLPADAFAKMVGVWPVERFATPLWMAVHFIVALSAAYAGRFRWGGIVYRIGGPNGGRGTRVLERKPYPVIRGKTANQ